MESNPDGPDEDDLNGEFVVLGNQAAEIDLTGWTVRDESSANRYALPDGFTLAEGAGVTIHTGCGEDTATDLYWCADQPVWNNDGDTALLLDPVGAPVSRYRYFED